MAINDALPLKAARHDDIAKLKSFWAANLNCRQTNAVSFRFALEHHVNVAYSVCDGLGWNQLLRVGKNSGPILSRLWTQVHEILGRCRDPLCFPTSCPIVYIVFRSEDIRY